MYNSIPETEKQSVYLPDEKARSVGIPMPSLSRTPKMFRLVTNPMPLPPDPLLRSKGKSDPKNGVPFCPRARFEPEVPNYPISASI